MKNKVYKDLNNLQDKIGEWSDITFDKGRQQAMLNHLEEEVDELKKDPNDILEYADCLLLLVDSARYSGYTFSDLIEGMKKKLEINKERKWGEPNKNGSINHIYK